MECLTPWFKRNKFCPYCRKRIIFPKWRKPLSKICELCGNGPSNFITRCHHFIHTKKCTNDKIPYRKCPICNFRISSNQRAEILNTNHVWTDEEVEADMPLPYLDLAIMICGNEHLMEKISFGFIMKKLFESGFIFNLLLKRCNLRLIDYACKGNNIAAIKELTRLGTDLNANVNC